MAQSLYLVLLQKPELDGDIVAHSLVLLAVGLEVLLGELYLGHGGGVAGAQVQLLQIGAVGVVLDPMSRGTISVKGWRPTNVHESLTITNP